jgi:hypothetical protein
MGAGRNWFLLVCTSGFRTAQCQDSLQAHILQMVPLGLSLK